MKRLKYILLLIPYCSSGQVELSRMRDVVRSIEVDPATNRVTFFQIFNVYNRTENNIMSYSANYFRSRGFKYTIDSTTNSVKAVIIYSRKLPKSCVGDLDVKTEVTIQAKASRARIVFTNLTYKGVGNCAPEGTIEELQKCTACELAGVYTWLYNAYHEEAKKLHKHYKEEVRGNKDW